MIVTGGDSSGGDEANKVKVTRPRDYKECSEIGFGFFFLARSDFRTLINRPYVCPSDMSVT